MIPPNLAQHLVGETSFDVTLCPNSGDQHPCTEWGWRFYDNFDIEATDLSAVNAGHRNDCQPICGGTPGNLNQQIKLLTNYQADRESS